MKVYTVYILECADSTFYTGCTSNLAQRLAQHERKYFPDYYTASRLPVALVWSQEFASADEMVAAERTIKGWSRQKKIALIDQTVTLSPRGEVSDSVRTANQPDKILTPELQTPNTCQNTSPSVRRDNKEPKP